MSDFSETFGSVRDTDRAPTRRRRTTKPAKSDRLRAINAELLAALEDAARLIEHLGGNAKLQREAISNAKGGEL